MFIHQHFPSHRVRFFVNENIAVMACLMRIGVFQSGLEYQGHNVELPPEARGQMGAHLQRLFGETCAYELVQMLLLVFSNPMDQILRNGRWAFLEGQRRAGAGSRWRKVVRPRSRRCARAGNTWCAHSTSGSICAIPATEGNYGEINTVCAVMGSESNVDAATGTFGNGYTTKQRLENTRVSIGLFWMFWGSLTCNPTPCWASRAALTCFNEVRAWKACRVFIRRTLGRCGRLGRTIALGFKC